MSILSQDFVDSESDFTIPKTTWLDYPKLCSHPQLTASEYIDMIVKKKMLIRVVSFAGCKTMIIFVSGQKLLHLLFNHGITYSTSKYYKPEWAYLTRPNDYRVLINIVDKQGKNKSLHTLWMGKPYLF